VGNFTLVHWDDHHQEADTQTSNGPTGPHPVEGLSSSLEDTTDDEDCGSEEDGPSSAQAVTSRPGEKGAKEGTAGEKRDDDPTGSGLLVSKGWPEW
jgi:hypothetical protein